MRKILCRRSVTLFFFVGITLGNAFSYAVAYHAFTGKKISCHCCSHGKFACSHCEKFGHQGKASLENKKTDVAIVPLPCKNSSDLEHLDFSIEPFLLASVKTVLSKFLSWDIFQIDSKLPSVVDELHHPPPRPLV